MPMLPMFCFSVVITNSLPPRKFLSHHLLFVSMHNYSFFYFFIFRGNWGSDWCGVHSRVLLNGVKYTYFLIGDTTFGSFSAGCASFYNDVSGYRHVSTFLFNIHIGT